MRALISVSDKTGLVDFAKELDKMGVEIISTGGTFKTLQQSGIKVKQVSEVTGFPEILDGRVKTLHPKIHGGLLALRDNPDHLAQLEKHKIEPIDMVVCNLYPFEETVARIATEMQTPMEEIKTEGQAEIIENIDIGGPSMLRSAAKNFKDVIVICDPQDYDKVIKELKDNKGEVSLPLRWKLAEKVYTRTSEYDGAIAGYFRLQSSEGLSLEMGKAQEQFPSQLSINLEKLSDLRYGENPHQKAAVYRDKRFESTGVVNAKQLQGKELSFNNYLDLEGAWNSLKDFSEPTVVIVKHTNPCGVAVGANLTEAYQRALSCDPVSAFGGIIGLNREVDEATALEITKLFTECIAAPGYSESALKVFQKKKDLRLMLISPDEVKGQYDYKTVSGGMVVQEKDSQLFAGELKVVTARQPSEQEMKALKFAWKVCKNVKSNAIILANENQTLGVGAGQMSRIDSTRIAHWKMKERTNDYRLSTIDLLVLASDAFFPFRDVVDEAAKIGVTAIIQPGGSIKDDVSIQACNEHKIAMVFTGLRHFKH